MDIQTAAEIVYGPPVVLRARITGAEHHALKVIAAQKRSTVADLTAEALRTVYPLTERKP